MIASRILSHRFVTIECSWQAFQHVGSNVFNQFIWRLASTACTGCVLEIDTKGHLNQTVPMENIACAIIHAMNSILYDVNKLTRCNFRIYPS